MNGTIYINPGPAGVVTLNNVTATDIQILSGATNSIYLNNVSARNLLVNSTTNVRVVFNAETTIDNTTVATGATLELEEGANITNASSVAINAPATIIAPKPVKAVVAEDVVVIIKESAEGEERELVGTGEEIDDLGAVAEALKAVNTASNADAMMTAIETNAATLGLAIGEGTDYAKLISGRDRSVSVDLYNNRPSVGYTLTQLREIFNDIVATRLVTQESMIQANEASTATELEGYVTMLLNRFNEIDNPIYLKHSSHLIADKITYLQDLVDNYDVLSIDAKEAVLRRVIELRNSQYGGQFARSQFTTDALKTALGEVVTEKNNRLSITSVSIVDNSAYASTAAGEGNTVRVLGYGIGINLDANSDGKKISDTTSIVVELYNGETLLGQQTFNEKGYSKHGTNSATSGTIDAGGQYVSTSWENSWSANISAIPTKAVAKVQYTDGIATAEYMVNLTQEQKNIFIATDAVYALFNDPFDDIEKLVLKEDITQETITAAQTKVNAVGEGSSHRTLFTEMLNKASSLLKTEE